MINNRNLWDLTVDIRRTEELIGYIDKKIVISASGIKTRSDASRMIDCGADAVLVGSSIMESRDVESKVRELVWGRVPQTYCYFSESSVLRLEGLGLKPLNEGVDLWPPKDLPAGLREVVYHTGNANGSRSELLHDSLHGQHSDALRDPIIHNDYSVPGIN